MIFLGSNVLIEHELKFEDIKPRLLGIPQSMPLSGNPLTFDQAIGGRVQA